MKWPVLAIMMVLAACSGGINRFVVEDETNIVAAANLDLCGSDTPLTRTGDRLAVAQEIDCEGSGRVRLRYLNGEEHDCNIGYVTHGLEENFTYQATDSGCSVLAIG